ncbi:hypothetical protein JCM17846_15440 [Iodidimonas nitroreducens]|uniref:Glycine cleavage system H protein n=1 Tax=Iodidimonas nitroreducens TaxID=1236968 RepID=A0A5A7N6B5_9PROT|nr:hypothetical protein JCM17846_15440 [Iodidimonas nitroreducens]
MSMIRFSKDHEWIRVEDGKGVIGITDYARRNWGMWCLWNCPKWGPP